MTLRQRQPELSDAALEDLRRLSEYVTQFDETAAERLVNDLVDKLHHIAEIGVTGSTRPFLPADVRAFPYRNWCFYFTVSDTTLNVLRVLSSDQDTRGIVFGSDDTSH